LIGLRWLAAAFYPSEVKLDLRAEARAFHRLFYGVVPGDAELSTLLESATD
jgi:iron complex transport system substrate-binding protein